MNTTNTTNSINIKKPNKLNNAFTLIELLIVISIIAILAAAIIPNFIGFDSEARISATKTNLDTLRMRVTLFRAKTGAYPVSLKDLLEATYFDAGIEHPYLDAMPAEMVSSKQGNSEYLDILSTEEPLIQSGGWIYYTDKARVRVNIIEPLDEKWGEYKGQKPIEW